MADRMGMVGTKRAGIVWGWPSSGVTWKFHAFRVSAAQPNVTRSLCGRYSASLYETGFFDPENGIRSPDECARCVKRVEASSNG